MKTPEVECTKCHAVIATEEAIGDVSKFICDDCAAEAAGIALEDAARMRRELAETSSACKRQPWCNRQVGHDGPCSASFMADGTVIS